MHGIGRGPREYAGCVLIKIARLTIVGRLLSNFISMVHDSARSALGVEGTYLRSG